MKPTTSRSKCCSATSDTMASTGWPGIRWVSSATPAACASARAAATTGAKRWFSSPFTSSTSSIVAGNRGSSSTPTMWSAAPSRWAKAIAAERAFVAPGEPSLATNIFANISGFSLRDSRRRGGKRLQIRLEPALGDQGRHDGAADDRRQEDRVLGLVDDVIGEAEERRDRAEGEPGRHQERRVHALAPLEPENASQRQDADKLGDHLDAEENQDQRGRRNDDVGAHERARLQEIEWRQDGKGDDAHPMHQFPVSEEHRREHDTDEISRQYRLALRGIGEAAADEEDQQN